MTGREATTETENVDAIAFCNGQRDVSEGDISRSTTESTFASARSDQSSPLGSDSVSISADFNSEELVTLGEGSYLVSSAA
jgi:hypothetical protein